MTLPRLILVGTGGRAYREYALQTLHGEVELCAVLPEEPTWQAPYLHDWRMAATSDGGQVTRAARELATDDCGILTWDETALEATAQAAEALGLTSMSPGAVAGCRDKHVTRSTLDRFGVSPVEHALVDTVDAARLAARRIGYPVVLKPRALAGSMGVSVVTDEDELADRFETASSAEYSTLPSRVGVLVEEYLDGPEISVESVVFDGDVTCVQAVRKVIGFHPWFEEVGHVVQPWRDEPWADDVCELVVEAHRALGVTHGVTHAEVRLTRRGPRLVELNGRLGGDLIPHLVHLVTGIDLVRAAAEIALGRRPHLPDPGPGAGEIAFVYPDGDVTVGRVDLEAAAALPGVVDTRVIAEPGETLRLPPRQAIPRLAAVIVSEDDPQMRSLRLRDAVTAVDARCRELQTVGG